MIRKLCFVLTLIGWQGRALADNVPFTLSLFGPISTNPLSYESTTSHVCIGLINCANLNVHGLTAAYGYNRVFNDLYGIGFGLFGNFVSHDGRGLEVAFGSNVNLGEFRGLQLSLVNVNVDTLKGLQFGASNYVHKGFAGLQLAALNISLGEAWGAQLGFVNYVHGPIHGLQMSTLNMSADRVDGAQVAITVNTTTEAMEGLQIAPVNIMSGDDSEDRVAMQVGLINVSHQARVVPFGLINVVRGGRFNLEVNRVSLGFNTISLASGSRFFYAIWNLEDRDINSEKKKLYHPRRTNAVWTGFGGGIPMDDAIFIRLERQEYSPTNYLRDRVLSIRLLGEFAYSNFFLIQGGLESVRWHYGENQRSEHFAGSKALSYGITAGVAVNLLGWWTVAKSPDS